MHRHTVELYLLQCVKIYTKRFLQTLHVLLFLLSITAMVKDTSESEICPSGSEEVSSDAERSREMMAGWMATGTRFHELGCSNINFDIFGEHKIQVRVTSSCGSCTVQGTHTRTSELSILGWSKEICRSMQSPMSRAFIDNDAIIRVMQTTNNPTHDALLQIKMFVLCNKRQRVKLEKTQQHLTA
eukprot:GILJ01012311.1.p1 GENE.GILJ01012311.1~~GILJ01012311.1.p1  ORF type:complete len:185 (+),score=13.00 GILJ01012311.1:131-685(+)